MKYALGNMLNGAGGLNADQLALDLQFAADKTLTARKGPTPVFTRAANATYFGPKIEAFGYVLDFDGFVGGRVRWYTIFDPINSYSIAVSYNGTQWELEYAQEEINYYYAAAGSEWRPDQADWSGAGINVTTSSTFGIIRAAVNEPRFDHDPVTLASRGLLIEEGRTNLVLQSENHPSATWNKTGGSVASVVNTAPDGSANSNLFSEDSSTGNHRLFQATAYVSGTSYAISVFLKFAGRQFVAITHPAVAANSQAIFNIQNGSVTLQQSGVTASITAYPNGWYRCVVNGVSSITASSSHIIQGSTTGSSLTGSYTGLNGPAFYIYGSQVEAGSFPTSYIPTTTSSLARSADVCGITNTAPFWNSSEFTVFTNANLVTSGVDAYASNFNITGGFFGARRPNTNQAIAIMRSSGVNADITFGSSGSFTTGSMRIAAAHSTGQQAASLNGGSAIQQNSAFVPTSNPIFNIGASNPFASSAINGHIVAIRYYKKRLSNQKLQAITA